MGCQELIAASKFERFRPHDIESAEELLDSTKICLVAATREEFHSYDAGNSGFLRSLNSEPVRCRIDSAKAVDLNIGVNQYHQESASSLRSEVSARIGYCHRYPGGHA